MTSLRKLKTNKPKSAKNKIKFTFTKDEDSDCSHGEIILIEELKRNVFVCHSRLSDVSLFEWEESQAVADSA